MNLRIGVLAFALLSLVIVAAQPTRAQTPSTAGEKPKEGTTTSAEARPTTPAPPYASILKDATPKSGLWTVYQKGQNLYWEIGGADYSAEYIVLISISRGIGQGQILGGMSWGFGDDWVWQFRKIGENVHVIRKNVRFKANANSPESKAVAAAY